MRTIDIRVSTRHALFPANLLQVWTVRIARCSVEVMSIRKDVVRVVKLKEFHSRVDQLLTPADRDYFFYALKEYNTYKSVAKLMLALNSCLDTPEKLDLLPSIRELIPKHDRRKFDNLAPYNRMAHPLVLQTHPSSPSATAADTTIERDESGRNGAKTEGKDDRSVEKHDPPGVMFGAVKTVFLQRESCKESFGFSIRGGREHDIGIFVSLVEPFSLAEGCGLMAGDKILSVNGFSFKNITHQSAVLILKSHNQLQISVVSVGHVPGLPRERKSLIWSVFHKIRTPQIRDVPIKLQSFILIPGLTQLVNQ